MHIPPMPIICSSIAITDAEAMSLELSRHDGHLSIWANHGG